LKKNYEKWGKKLKWEKKFGKMQKNYKNLKKIS